jgi:hypothetical protein
MFLGRIVSGAKIQDVPFYIEVTKKFTDDGVPTLVVGKKRAVEIFGAENVHVLDRSINEHISWTYAKNERRNEYEEDIDKFKKSITKKLKSNVSYYFVNIFIERYSFFKKMLKWIDSDAKKSVYLTDKHIYIYGGKNVIGLSLGDFDYAGIDSDKIIDRIKKNPSNSVFTDEDFNGETERKIVSDNNLIVPYIHFLTH